MSSLGKDAYSQYVEFACRRAYNQIFEILDGIPEQYISLFTKILDISANETQLKKLSEKEITYIKIE